MKLEFSGQIFEKYSDIKFYEIPSSGSRVPCGQTGRRTDMTKLIVCFRNCANSPKNAQSLYIDTLLAYTICVSFDATRPEARLQAPPYRRNISSTANVSSLNYYKSFPQMEEWHKAVGPFLHCFTQLYECMMCFFLQSYCKANTDMRRLTTGIREKCVVRRFRRCANV